MQNESKSELPDTPSTSKRQPSVARQLAVVNGPVNFQPESKLHRQRLLQWCTETWSADFHKAIAAGNPPVYHDCCCAFSRRAFCRHASHPSLESCAVTKIPSFKDLEKPEDLYRWMLKTLQNNFRLGYRCFFPRFNVLHSNEDGLDDIEMATCAQKLRSRLQELTKLTSKQEETIKNLRSENDQLLHATKSWYQKYQEITDASDKTPPSMFSTPLKRTSNSNFGFLDGEYYALVFSASIFVDPGLDSPGICFDAFLASGGSCVCVDWESSWTGRVKASFAESTASLFVVSSMLSTQ